MVGFTYLTWAFSLRPQAGPSGLSFLLVIPLQRITKYPLLLQKILENTPPDSGAYPVLQRATSAVQDVNTNINEYKRRKEVGKDLGKSKDTLVRRLRIIKKKKIISNWLHQYREGSSSCNHKSRGMCSLGRVCSGCELSFPLILLSLLFTVCRLHVQAAPPHSSKCLLLFQDSHLHTAPSKVQQSHSPFRHKN